MCYLDKFEQCVTDIDLLIQEHIELKLLQEILHETLRTSKFEYSKKIDNCTLINFFLESVIIPLNGYISILNKGICKKNIAALTSEIINAILTLKHFLLQSESSANEFVKISDTPIGRIAFFNRFACSVIKALTDETEIKNDQFFYYLVMPGISSKTETIDISCLKPEESKLSILYIPYSTLISSDKKTVCSLICHEIAHQVGTKKRHRENRFTNLIQCFVINILARSIPETQFCYPFYCFIIENMAKIVADYLLDYYQKHTEDDKFYLASIRSFMNEYSYLVDFFAKEFIDIDFRDKIIKNWMIMFESLENDQQASLKKYCSCELYTNMFSDDGTSWKTISTYLFSRIERYCTYILDNSYEYEKHFDLCNIIMKVFSESYADLCMFELMNIDAFDDYEKINNYKVDSHLIDSNYEDIFRRNAALQYFLCEVSDSVFFVDELMSSGCLIQNIINTYLNDCRSSYDEANSILEHIQ